MRATWTEPAEPKPHEDPHDWGIDSYRCLRCGANRDDAPDQPCRPAAPKPASTLVACVSKAIYHGEGAPAEDAIRAVAEWLDNAGSGYAATILRVGLEP